MSMYGSGTFPRVFSYLVRGVWKHMLQETHCPVCLSLSASVCLSVSVSVRVCGCVNLCENAASSCAGALP